jgi:hypothetical protein
VDHDAREPWGRAVVPPGAATCEVRVTWASARYPLLVDPAWTTTGALTDARRRHGAVTLSTGRVFAVGGTGQPSNAAQTPIASTELYDPKTGTWAGGAPLPTARVGHTTTVLADHRVLVAGGEIVTAGNQAATATTLFYDPVAAKWTPGPDMTVAATGGKAVLLTNNRVLVTENSAAQELDPSGAGGAGSWISTPTIPLDTAEYVLAAGPASVGKAILAGGWHFATLGYIYQSSYVLYDIAAHTWTKSPNSMKAARAKHSAAVLPNGSVLVAGGENGGTVPIDSAEIYDWATDTWSTTGTLTTGRSNASLVLLPNGFALLAGGVGLTTELFAPSGPSAGTWLPGGDMTDARFDFPLVVLPSGQAVAVGGDNGSGALGSTEVFGVATSKACVDDGQCLSGHCADGVCCDTACDGDCMACSAAAKGAGADGTCEAVAKGRDPHAKCGASDVATCGAAGQGCDGAGACVKYGAETQCRPKQCTGGAETTSVCDGKGGCQPHGTSCGAYACGGDSCKQSCSGDTDCASGTTCDTTATPPACVSATRCASDHEQQNPDGTTSDCGAYRCLGVACVNRCGSVDDCLAGYVCDKDAHCVVAGGGTPSSSGGCAIATSARTGDGEGAGGMAWGIASIALGFGARLRRRRR